jgi:TRAP-type C4-dicarboxylate transport system permease small subunit
MERIVGIIRAVQQRIAMLALVVMMLTTVADVFMRYVLRRPIEGAYNVVECCLAVFVFFGIASTFIGRRNIVIDLIDGVASRQLLAALAALVRCADTLAVLSLGVIFWAMIDPALQVYEYGDVKPELGLPLAVLWVAALVGLAGTVVSAIGTLMTPAPPPMRDLRG